MFEFASIDLISELITEIRHFLSLAASAYLDRYRIVTVKSWQSTQSAFTRGFGSPRYKCGDQGTLPTL